MTRDPTTELPEDINEFNDQDEVKESYSEQIEGDEIVINADCVDLVTMYCRTCKYQSLNKANLREHVQSDNHQWSCRHPSTILCFMCHAYLILSIDIIMRFCDTF